MRMFTTLTRRPSACLTAVFTIALESESSCTASLQLVGGVGAQFLDRAHHELDGAVHGAAHLVAQPESHLLHQGRLAGDHNHLAWPGAERLHEAKDGLGFHPVRVEHLAVLDAGLDVVLLCLHHVERAGPTSLAATT